MTVYEISRLMQHVRFFRIPLKQGFSRTYVSNLDPKQQKDNRWYSFIRRWKWSIPIGVGISLLTVLQCNYFKKYPDTTKDYNVYEPINILVIKCYYFLPFRTLSKLWGWIASIELPTSLRPILYEFYAKTFNANLEEIDLELSEFPSLVDFFVRPLKYDARPIDQTANIVSPADGKVIHFGPVTSCCVQQVKGVTYNLRHFLGDINVLRSDRSVKFTKEDDDNYVKSLLTDPMNQLYQLIIYLAPGDYHRFHSPTEWDIQYRRHFQGKLISVNPKIVQYLPNLFSLNERVVYIGKWINGFMAYTAVGATNVGSIKVYCDKELHTNAIKWPKATYWKDASLDCTHLKKGELFGEFRMGSTIVLLFEAPKDFKFCIQEGQTIKMGQALCMCNVETDEKQHAQSL